MHNHSIAARVLNTPLLLEPGYARVFIGALAPRLGITGLMDEHGAVEHQDKLRLRADAFETSRERNRPYQVVDGVALLPVSGSLVHKFGHLQPYSGMTGYDGLVARIEDALGDDSVSGVLLDVDSPGGEVSGCFDCARRIASLRGTKPIGAIAYDTACSAAMAISSAADYRYTTSSARMGSIGVVMMHVSMEERLKEQGYEVTLIHSGALKTAGNPYQALPADVLARFQADSDQMRQQFAELISDHMGLSVGDILATEAAIYTGQGAIDAGLADELVNGHDMLAAFRDYTRSTTHTTVSMGATTMTEENKGPDATPSTSAGTDTQAAEASARQGERERISGILNCEEAEGRTSLASHLAFSTQMSVDDAKAALAAAEPAGTTGGGSLLDAAMGNTDQPLVGADAQADGAEDDVNPLVAGHLAACGKPRTH